MFWSVVDVLLPTLMFWSVVDVLLPTLMFWSVVDVLFTSVMTFYYYNWSVTCKALTSQKIDHVIILI
jgi:hypothetical protein